MDLFYFWNDLLRMRFLIEFSELCPSAVITLHQFFGGLEHFWRGGKEARMLVAATFWQEGISFQTKKLWKVSSLWVSESSAHVHNMFSKQIYSKTGANSTLNHTSEELDSPNLIFFHHNKTIVQLPARSENFGSGLINLGLCQGNLVEKEFNHGI